MTTPEQDQFADRWQQHQHAELIRQRREGKEPPETHQDAALEALIASRVDMAVTRALANFTIQSGQNVTISGSGRNITISVNLPPQALQPLFIPEWFELTLCDGTTLEVAARNIVPP